jgi:hypothetical protein
MMEEKRMAVTSSDMDEETELKEDLEDYEDAVDFWMMLKRKIPTMIHLVQRAMMWMSCWMKLLRMQILKSM